MAFNSMTFLIFMCGCAALYYAVPAKLCRYALLAESLVFYMWTAPLGGITLALTAAAGYLFAFLIDGAVTEKKKKTALTSGVVLLAGALIAFKYLSFFTSVASDIGALLGASPLEGTIKLLIPLGISFYTLQLIGYLVDVYHGKTAFEADVAVHCLFVCFFPQVMSGPIGRAKELMPQFKAERRWDYGRTVEALERFAVGAFKKIVVADGLAVLVNGVYGNLADCRGLTVLVAVILYAVQLLADFSGYSDMAVGAALLFGIRLRENFAAPYYATNFSTFWKRWHISLSSWLEDYVFVPLVWSRWWNRLFFGKRADEHAPHFLANLIIVFIVSGLWHGAAYTFVLWGLVQGVFRVGEELLHRWRRRPKKLKSKKLDALRALLKRLAVFALWALSLVLFRSPTLADARLAFAQLLRYQAPGEGISRLLYYASNEIAASGTYYLLFFGVLSLASALFFYFEARVNAFSDCFNPLGCIAGKKRWLVFWFIVLSTAMFYSISFTAGSAVSFIYAGF